MRTMILVLLVLMLIPASHAATIQGTVYDWTTLEPVPKTIITVNSNPLQTYVSKDGTYSFELPFGVYTLSAVHYTNNVLDSAINETITITGDGSFTMDLILFPEIDFGSDLINDSDFDLYDPYGKTKGLDFYSYLAIAAILIFVYIFRKPLRGIVKSRHAEKKIQNTVPENGELSGELKKVVSVLKKNGGRMTQKDIRQEFPLSEGKVSLMITELESMGVVKRIKSGRTNVVVFQKKSDS
ncbi:MAG: hypothetical protein KAI53_04540 [Candidatus Aenigmarchaeota archaeon]|nr:hypothetical protein [Candidatus Aenigmarchaeota archaeon]